MKPEIVTFVFAGRTCSGTSFGEERKGKLVVNVGGMEYLIPKEMIR